MNIIVRKLFLIILVSFCFVNLKATHNRAGEITVTQLSDLTFEITLTTFTYTLSLADRPTLDIEWGDNTISTAQRIPELVIILPNYYRRNVYKKTHTYPGPGVYKIIMQDPNRNANVLNIPNSVNVVFSISTTIIVNPSMGRNDTPVLLNPPYDKAALGYIFIHNPSAYDADGDSLSYKITTCTGTDAKPIVNYTLPPATHYLRVDSISGDLIWDSPADTGKYNVAMEIQAWRGGKKISSVVRDMQIEVYETNYKPPVNSPLRDYCVEAGQPVDFIFSATVANNDALILRATSGVFSVSPCPATFTGIDSVPGSASSRFQWVPCFQAVRNQPYTVLFKSEDNSTSIRLADLSNIKIKVLGPSPVILNAVPEGKQIRLTWKNYGTDYITGFNIYRREGATTFIPDSCTSGLPASTGFVKVGFASGSATTSFSDADAGQGLQFGKDYTYRIVAVFPNGTESKASNEITSTLVSGVPVIKNISVRNTDAAAGSIFVAWKKPDRLDTIPANGPYKYIISRASGTGGTNYFPIDSIFTSNLNDTTLVDTLFDTRSKGYIYKIELWNIAAGNQFLVGDPGYASSVYLSGSPGNKKARFVINRNVPWINTNYDFFRLNETTQVYDSIGSTNQLTFTDFGLVNGKQYCYYIRSVGGYLADNLPKNLINFSEKTCVTPVDNEPPCQPVIAVSSKCDSLYNTITWSVADTSCSGDIAGFRIYNKMITDTNLALLIDIPDKNVFSYKHSPGEIMASCYAVSAYDSNGNESQKSLMVCVIDSCNFYEIPNVFTPNGDNINEKLIAKTSGLIEKVDFKLFNRSGLLLFSTADPKIEWDGTYKGKIVSPGVYFYECGVYERGASGLVLKHISGFVHVITEEGAKLKPAVTK
jgi:gliding motility-associated-like protein